MKTCKVIIKLLGNTKIPKDRENIKSPKITSEMVGNFFLALVAICHQTSPLGKSRLEGEIDGKHFFGWDYLYAKWEYVTKDNTKLLEPRVWANISENDLNEIFDDKTYGNRLTNVGRRAELLRDIGRKMLKRKWMRVEDIYRYCHGAIDRDYPSLLTVLNEFDAYKDPMKKKSLYFLSLMKNSHTWSYVDDENLGPPIDYHEIRGHLRLGTIRVLDGDLEHRLKKQLPVSYEEELMIRKSVYEVVTIISDELKGITSSQLHYFFWNIFRVVCSRENPGCKDFRNVSALPKRYLETIINEGNRYKCPFNDVCPSSGEELRYLEPYIETEYY